MLVGSVVAVTTLTGNGQMIMDVLPVIVLSVSMISVHRYVLFVGLNGRVHTKGLDVCL